MNREIEKLLIQNGFKFIRNNKHGLWSNGDVVIVTSLGKHTAPRTLKSMKSKLNRLSKGLPLTPYRFLGGQK